MISKEHEPHADYVDDGDQDEQPPAQRDDEPDVTVGPEPGDTEAPGQVDDRGQV